jgi:hypothetical protein
MKAVTISAIAALTLGSSVLLAGPASAETLTGDPCARVDVHATVGTTINYTYWSDCVYLGARLDTGSPTIAFNPGGNNALVWHQAVEAPADGKSCPDGWGASWGDWARGGKGGPTCVADIVWGTGPKLDAVLSVTINTPQDHVTLFSGPVPFATGCGYGDQGFPIEGNCPPLT